MIYKLDTNIEEYMTLDLDSMSLGEQLAEQSCTKSQYDSIDDLVEMLFHQPYTNKSMFEIWSNVTATLFSPYKEVSRKADVSVWIYSYLLLSRKALDVLKTEIGACGEFLPLSVNGEEMYIFNCMEFGKEDPEKCATDTYGAYCEIAFDTSDVEDKMLFKSKLLSGTGLYATERFKNRYERAGLSGLSFRSELCSGGIE